MSLPSNTVQELENTIALMTISGKGILAADESTPTISKRFGALNIPCTEDTRKQYRELLFTTPDIEKYIAGVILYEETLLQSASNGLSFPALLAQKGIVSGIKVDKGLVSLPNSEEKVTQGLDGLAERLQAYKKQGARFAKWRAVYAITENTPSSLANKTNAIDLARYAAICQAQGIVPIVEPEILIDGNHSLDTCKAISEKVLHKLFHQLYKHKVLLEYIILKPSMVTPGKSSAKASPEAIAEASLSIFKRTVPCAVPSINFLSGGQTPLEATQNLNAINQFKPAPWNLSFSFARALQEPCMQAWLGKSENSAVAQKEFLQCCKNNSLAVMGNFK